MQLRQASAGHSMAVRWLRFYSALSAAHPVIQLSKELAKPSTAAGICQDELQCKQMHEQQSMSSFHQGSNGRALTSFTSPTSIMAPNSPS